MFDIGWSELVVIAVVALVVIGPKELPMVLKTVGGWMARARAMAREFQSGVDDILRESEIEKYRKQAQDLAMLHPETALRSILDPDSGVRPPRDGETSPIAGEAKPGTPKGESGET